MSGQQPIGGLRDRVQLLRRESVAEPEGGHTNLFVPIAILWARVTPIGAREAQLADGRTVAATHSVVLRHRTGIGPGDRFVHRGRNLNVVSAEDITGRRNFLACRCSETAVSG